MKYNININQYELCETEVSLQEAVVIDWLNGMFSSDSERVRIKRLEGWTWISLAHLIDDMPLLRIKTNSGASKLLKRVKLLGYIELKSDGHGKNLYAKPTEKMNDLYFSKSHRTRKCVPKETDSVQVDTGQVLEDTNQYTISDTLDTNTNNHSNKVIEELVEDINVNKLTLPIERGTTPHNRVDTIYGDLFKDKYGFKAPVANIGLRLKIFKELLKSYTEIQLSFLLIVFFAWKGMNDSDDKAQNYLQSKTHDVFSFKFNISQYEAYTRNVTGYNEEFNDSDSLLPIVGKYITELKKRAIDK